MCSQITIAHNGIKIDKRDFLIVFNNTTEDNESRAKNEHTVATLLFCIGIYILFVSANKFGKCVDGIQSVNGKTL